MLEILEAKLKEVTQKIEASFANHNALLGAKMTLENLYKDFKAAEPVIEGVAAVVVPAETPVIDTAITEINNVAGQILGQ
jgi:hypothetical protein